MSNKNLIGNQNKTGKVKYKLSVEQIQEIKQLKLDGQSMKDIAMKFGITPYAVKINTTVETSKQRKRRLKRANDYQKQNKEQSARYKKKYDANRRKNNRYLIAQYAAKDRKKEFTLSEQLYYSLVSQPCTYCNDKLKNKNELGIGLDRIDNSKGYLIDNVLPSCGFCNTFRGNKFTVTETKALIGLLVKLRFENPHT